MRKLLTFLLFCLPLAFAQKPRLTLDDFFNGVDIRDVELSADGRAVVISAQRADWDKQYFRKDLWLYRDDSPANQRLVQLTQSGHDTDPQFSPDGKWVAFLSDRKAGGDES